MATEPVKKSIKIIDQAYSPEEARDIISSVIDSHINFYKLQHLKNWVGDHSTTTEERDQKIEELLKKKKELHKIIESAKQEDLCIKIRGVFDMKLEKKS